MLITQKKKYSIGKDDEYETNQKNAYTKISDSVFKDFKSLKT